MAHQERVHGMLPTTVAEIQWGVRICVTIITAWADQTTCMSKAKHRIQ